MIPTGKQAFPHTKYIVKIKIARIRKKQQERGVTAALLLYMEVL